MLSVSLCVSALVEHLYVSGFSNGQNGEGANSVKPTGNKSLFPSTSERRPVKNSAYGFGDDKEQVWPCACESCVWGARLLEALFDSCSEALVINFRNV